MAEPTAPRTLADTARAYTRGELASAEVEAFEDRLALDQMARDALIVAVQEQAGPDAGALRPDPAYRREVIRRLHPQTWHAWLAETVIRGWGPRLAWALAAICVLLAPPFFASRPAPVAEVSPPDQVERTEPHEAVARYWSDLPRGDHLVRAVEEEEAARKLRLDATRPGRPDATVRLQPDGPMMP